MGCVGFAPKFGGVKQVDQVVFEIAGAFPLLLVPVGEGRNGEDTGDVSSKGAIRVSNPAKLHTFRFFEHALDALWSHLVGGKCGTMHEVEFFIREQTRTREIGGADDGGNRLEAVKATTTIEEIRFGMQKALCIQAHLHLFLAQKLGQVFDEAQGLLVVAGVSEVFDKSLDGMCANLA